MKITLPPPSPIENLGERVSRLRHDKLLAFSTFCAQAAIRNVDVYLTAVKSGQGVFNDRLDSWFWQKLPLGVAELPYDYEVLEEELMDFTNKLKGYATQNNISPVPNPVMVRESVFIFICTCSFFAGKGDVSQLLITINNCISCKIDYYYQGELGMQIYKGHSRLMPTIYHFPVYSHALADLEWALTLIEREENLWVSGETLQTLRLYAGNCPAFLVDHPFYYRG